MDSLTWVLVADAANARIFSTKKVKLFTSGDKDDLNFVSEHAHAESRKRDKDLKSDKQGQFGTGTFSEATDPKHHEAEVFSQELAKLLQSSHLDNHYRDLILVAPPHFMGLLNKHISHALSKIICLRIEKDYTKYNEQQLAAQLKEYL